VPAEGTSRATSHAAEQPGCSYQDGDVSAGGHMADPSDDGVLVREAITEDAGALLALKGALDRETSFMLLEPDELETTEAEAAERAQSGRRSTQLSRARRR
jgi:hypothetical protein